MSKPNQFAYKSVNRLIDIISTTNPRFKRYFTTSDYDLEFWVDNGYRIYKPYFKQTYMSDQTLRVNQIRMLVDVLKQNGFEEVEI